jgi:hypothetical protein
LLPAGAWAQEARPDRLAAIAWLVGDWTGTGEGQVGRSTVQRQIARIHNDRFIRVEARSDYPPQPNNPGGEVHSTTDVWSFDRRRGLLVMRQFNSLGFVLTYVQDAAASSGGRIVLVSEALENGPPGWRTRYTYERVGEDGFQELFELDSGNGMAPYVTNRFRRVAAAAPAR